MPRPPLPDEERRKVRQIRMTDADWALIGDAAAAKDVTASDLIRDAAVREAKRTLKKAEGGR